MKHLETVIDSGLFCGLDKGSYIRAYESLDISHKEYRRSGSVFHESDIIDKLCIVEAGSVRAEKTYYNGNVHLVDIYNKNSFFAIEFLMSRKKTSDMDYFANENCSVVFISFESILGSPFRDELMTILIHTLAMFNIKMERKIDMLAEKSLRDKILMYLNLMSERSRSREFSTGMTREQLAQFLCVNRSALSNELSKMKRDGMIDFKKDHFILKSERY